MDHLLLFAFGIGLGYIFKSLGYWLKEKEVATASELEGGVVEPIEFTFGDYDFRYKALIKNGYFTYKTRKPGNPEGKIPFKNVSQLSLDIQRILKNYENEVRWDAIEAEIKDGNLEVVSFRFELDDQYYEYSPESRDGWMVGIYNPDLPKEEKAMFDPNKEKLDRTKNRLYSHPPKMAKDTAKNLKEWRRLVPFEMAAWRLKRLN